MHIGIAWDHVQDPFAFEGKGDPFLAACSDIQAVSFAVTVVEIQVIALSPEAQRIHVVVDQYTWAVDQLAAHADRAVVLGHQRFSEEVFVHQGPREHWDIPDLDRWVFLDNSIDCLEGSACCDLKVSTID